MRAMWIVDLILTLISYQDADKTETFVIEKLCERTLILQAKA